MHNFTIRQNFLQPLDSGLGDLHVGQVEVFEVFEFGQPASVTPLPANESRLSGVNWTRPRWTRLRMSRPAEGSASASGACT
jgi:hypothetical protein